MLESKIYSSGFAPGSIEAQLFERCAIGTLEEVTALLDTGVDVNIQDDLYLRPIHLAANNPDIRIAKLLVERGADTNALTMNDIPPLGFAAESNTLEMVKYFVSLGNDPLEETTEAGNMLVFAACNPHKDVLEYFLELGVDINGWSNPLYWASRLGSFADMDFFIDRGANLEQALHFAYHSKVPIENFRHLLERGCDVKKVRFYWKGRRCNFTKLPDSEYRDLMLKFSKRRPRKCKRVINK